MRKRRGESKGEKDEEEAMTQSMIGELRGVLWVAELLAFHGAGLAGRLAEAVDQVLALEVPLDSKGKGALTWGKRSANLLSKAQLTSVML
ncbi:hypothetical protein GOP47_0016287 [Adiantum capillus-veneris]|uniref:Uncharacterized protein n=1 Tax=Adiantum capillus-veneris TaxID=13818 RepID=A0A9D4ZBL7_ADICA|nr:hypothetical protein GOP47_0016287 [Adiantum capillus-veneris]